MSLQRRLVAVMSILLVVGLLVADVVTYVSVRSFLYGRADVTLASSEALAFNYVAYNTERKTPLSAADLSRHVSPDVYVLIIDHAGKVVMSRPSGSPTRPDPRPLVSASVPVQRLPGHHEPGVRPLWRDLPSQPERGHRGEHAGPGRAATGWWP